MGFYEEIFDEPYGLSDYDEYYDEEEQYRIGCRNEARKSVLNMINEHNNLNLEELRFVKRQQNDGIKTVCHSAVCYDYPGIVSCFCYGGVTPEGEFVYFWG